jgi:hypothetical protein
METYQIEGSLLVSCKYHNQYLIMMNTPMIVRVVATEKEGTHPLRGTVRNSKNSSSSITPP